MPPYNMFGLEDTSYEKARVVFLPVPYDSQTTYRSGTRDGPHAIINASRSIELFNEELEEDVSKIGMYTLEELSPNLDSPEKNAKLIEKEVGLLLDDGKLPVLLGGDHSIAIGSIRAASKKYGKELSILHFDAHSDSRDEFMGSRYNHACVMARAREVCSSCYSIGVRSTDEEGYRRNRGAVMYRKDMHGKNASEIVGSLVKGMKKKVYITLDFDVLDPSEMPSVGTPEPDGLGFHELASIINGVLAQKTLVGADFVELLPIAGMVAPDFLAAKLIYLTLGYASRKK
jgi:agmatinase